MEGTVGAGVPRSFGGCTILCAVAGGFSGVEGEGVDVARIEVPSTSDYQRAFVSATITGIDVVAPDGPPIDPDPDPGSEATVYTQATEFEHFPDGDPAGFLAFNRRVEWTPNVPCTMTGATVHLAAPSGWKGAATLRVATMEIEMILDCTVGTEYIATLSDVHFGFDGLYDRLVWDVYEYGSGTINGQPYTGTWARPMSPATLPTLTFAMNLKDVEGDLVVPPLVFQSHPL